MSEHTNSKSEGDHSQRVGAAVLAALRDALDCGNDVPAFFVMFTVPPDRASIGFVGNITNEDELVATLRNIAATLKQRQARTGRTNPNPNQN